MAQEIVAANICKEVCWLSFLPSKAVLEFETTAVIAKLVFNMNIISIFPTVLHSLLVLTSMLAKLSFTRAMLSLQYLIFFFLVQLSLKAHCIFHKETCYLFLAVKLVAMPSSRCGRIHLWLQHCCSIRQTSCCWFHPDLGTEPDRGHIFVCIVLYLQTSQMHLQWTLPRAFCNLEVLRWCFPEPRDWSVDYLVSFYYDPCCFDLFMW